MPLDDLRRARVERARAEHPVAYALITAAVTVAVTAAIMLTLAATVAACIWIVRLAL